jgi:guanosine-3',5'-bis(diphosphate) 3'-pyrophosphohydrolase
MSSMKAHGSQRAPRATPISRTRSRSPASSRELKLDSASIATGCSTIRSRIPTRRCDEIQSVRRGRGPLVDGVTKLSRLELQSDSTKHAENFRKLVLAMSNGHPRAAGQARRPPAQHAHAAFHQECRQAPAHCRARRWISTRRSPSASACTSVKDELEDLAFAETQSRRGQLDQAAPFILCASRATDICAKIDHRAAEDAEGSGSRGRGLGPREDALFDLAQDAEEEWSSSSSPTSWPSASWSKDVGQCYQALGALHGRYPVMPGRFKDYISTPKPNGYRSLHTGVIGPQRQRIEVQIRTDDMHDHRRNGRGRALDLQAGRNRSTGRNMRWLRELLDILEHASGPRSSSSTPSSRCSRTRCSASRRRAS